MRCPPLVLLAVAALLAGCVRSLPAPAVGGEPVAVLDATLEPETRSAATVQEPPGPHWAAEGNLTIRNRTDHTLFLPRTLPDRLCPFDAVQVRLPSGARAANAYDAVAFDCDIRVGGLQPVAPGAEARIPFRRDGWTGLQAGGIYLVAATYWPELYDGEEPPAWDPGPVTAAVWVQAS